MHQLNLWQEMCEMQIDVKIKLHTINTKELVRTINEMGFFNRSFFRSLSLSRRTTMSGQGRVCMLNEGGIFFNISYSSYNRNFGSVYVRKLCYCTTIENELLLESNNIYAITFCFALYKSYFIYICYFNCI